MSTGVSIIGQSENLFIRNYTYRTKLRKYD